MGKPYLSLKDKSMMKPTAYFLPGETDSLADLNKGQQVIMFCDIGSFEIEAVRFDKCVLAKNAVARRVLPDLEAEVQKCMSSECKSDAFGFELALIMAYIHEIYPKGKLDQIKTATQIKEAMNAAFKRIEILGKSKRESDLPKILREAGYQLPKK